MQLITERLFLIPLQPDGMRALLARTTDPELIQPYTDMLNLSLATEAVRAACRWAFEQPGVTAVEAETAPDHTASQAVLHRVGFVPTGTMGAEGPRFILRQKP